MGYDSYFGLFLAVVAFSAYLAALFIALLLSIWGILQLRGEPPKVKLGWLFHAKWVSHTTLIATLVVNLILIALWDHAFVLASIFLSVLLFASLPIAWYSIRAHKSTIKPSDTISVYFAITVALDGLALACVDHPVHAFRENFYCRMVVFDFIIRLILLYIENYDKRAILLPKYNDVSPEETAGLFSKATFWWLKSLLVLGNKRVLGNGDMFQLDRELNPESQRKAILRAWDQRTKPESPTALPRALLRCLASPFILTAIPRAILVILTCSQPLLIEWAIDSVRSDATAEPDKYVLCFFTVVVYFGLAFATAVYYHQLKRLEVRAREALITLIYDKTLSIDAQATDAGKSVTLMSTDVAGAVEIAEMFHETWGKLIELIVGMVLFAQRVNWIWPVPLITIFLCSQVSKFVAQNIRARQRGWNAATQKRISALGSILGSMNSVKAVGLSNSLENHVTSLRRDEIENCKRLRWMEAAYNASANANGMFTPVIAIVVFAIVAKASGTVLDEKTAFSATAILFIVTHPANMVMTLIPRFVAVFGNFDRIQAYLLEPEFTDAKEPSRYNRTTPSATGRNENNAAISVTDASVVFPTQSTPILSGINLTLLPGTVTMCSGPVGSGKSTLAKLILGEVTPTTGHVAAASTSVGFCDQKPWLPSGTVREIVCAFGKTTDQNRYEKVISACSLDYDIDRFPLGHDTVIGTRGINLSGGQKQRLALARLLYARNDLVVLDDPFNALDGDTENQIIENLFGSDGLFRKDNTTVFLITNSGQQFHLADYIVLLGDEGIKKQGNWDEMKASIVEMEKFTFDAVEAKAKDTDVKPANTSDDSQTALLRRTGDLSLYSYYLRAAGLFNSSLLIFCSAAYSFFNTVPAYWIKLWTESERGDGRFSTYFYMVGYVLLALVAWIATNGIFASAFLLVGPQSGKVLHQRLLSTVFAAPLAFFSSTDLGVTLNRFGQDISLVDRQLPRALQGLLVQIFKMLSQVSILFVLQKQLAITLPVCIIVVYFVQRVYLRTSRQLRVLEIEAQAVLYSWFLETADGVATIRAFKWQSDAESKNLDNLNFSLRPVYALYCVQRWLNLVLDLLVAGVAVCVVVIAMGWRGSTSQGDIGAALNIILVANSTLIKLVQSWTTLEVSLGGISRLKSVNENTPPEDQATEDFMPPSSWPMKGNLAVSNMSASYTDNNLVLKDVNLDVDDGQKLVICGRTGSGKSTAVLALLRLVDTSGKIEVNGIDITRVPRSVVRGRCFITVPQDALVLAKETLRFNLDPTSLAPDSVLRDALSKVGLWARLSDESSESSETPLDEQLSSLPIKSVGQLQLLSMARAIVQKFTIAASTEYSDHVQQQTPKPILLLDEATASLDAETEKVIYDIIESEFTAAGHTVIIIAHKLSAVSGRMREGRDLVAWFQDGELVKVGEYEEVVKFVSTSSDSESAEEE